MSLSPVAIRPLLLKPQWMNGLSERLLVSHYENNYGGALRRLNAIRARLAGLDWASTPVFEINGLKREELIATGSVILHEMYFDSLGGMLTIRPLGATSRLPNSLRRLNAISAALGHGVTNLSRSRKPSVVAQDGPSSLGRTALAAS